ncbi:MAG: NAD(P)/FAD-dependent oxidoreductase [Myxococcota bacterium]
MTEPAPSADHVYNVVVVGAGAAGIGVGVALHHAEVPNVLVVDRHGVGASFDRWPAETRFITPSFPTNSIGMLDINSVAIGVSPAFSMKSQHPTGSDYAEHLRNVAELFELPIRPNTDVTRVQKADGLFRLDTNHGTLLAKHVIWAAGEFQYPERHPFPGSELCRHTMTLPSYRVLEGDEFIVIGGYESGIDVAYHLSKWGKTVRVLDEGRPWEACTSDPSVALSTFSEERMVQSHFAEKVELIPDAAVVSVRRDESGYEVKTADGRTMRTDTPPLLATGFSGGHTMVADLFEQRDDGFPLLTERDESTVTPGIFICGPAVRHDARIFCFLYKYRQRFGIVVKAIATSLGVDTHAFEEYYRAWGMFLDDFWYFGEECAC